LGTAANALSDAQVTELRDELYAIGNAAVRTYGTDRPQPFKTLTADMPDDDRVAIEERAAILEFDGKLPRDKAERLALGQFASRPAGSRH